MSEGTKGTKATSAPVILTHCGKLGDFLYCLPIAEWFYKTHGRRTHWVLTENFAPFRYVKKLLLNQRHCCAVTLVDHKLANLDAGGQPYKFDPAQHRAQASERILHELEELEANEELTHRNELIAEHARLTSDLYQLGGWDGDYFNLGFRSYPNKFITAFCAEEYGLGWDADFTLELGEVEPSGKILRTEQREVGEACPEAEPFPIPIDLLELGQRLKAARERHTWYSGPAALMYLARLPFHLHWEQGHPPRSLYLPEEHFGGKLITPVEYIRRKA